MRLYEAGRYAEAAPELERALRLDPAQHAAARALARIWLLLGKPDRAVSVLRSAGGSPKTTPEPDFLLAIALARAGDLAGAGAVLDALLSRTGRVSAEVYALAARMQVRQRDARKAAEICERGMRLYPESDQIAAVYAGLPAEALAERLAVRYERAQDSSDVSELVALARALSDMDPARKTAAAEMAQQLLERAIRQAPGNASAHYQYGRVLRLRAGPEAILAAWEKALSLSPPPALAVELHTQIARQKRTLSDFAAADREFRAALRINRSAALRNPAAAFEFVLFLKAQGQAAEAEGLIGEILRWDPLSLPAHMERARGFASRERWNAALESAGFVLNGEQDDLALLRSAHALAARACSALNRPEDARRHQAWVESH